MQSSPLESQSSRAYWLTARNVGAVLPASIGSGVAVRMLMSGISPGTESLVARGEVPPSSWEAMRCLGMEGQFAFPVKYGYSAIGRALEGKYQNQRVFCLHPHQEFFRTAEDHLLPIPDLVSDLRATLIPNVETALNAVWDGEVLPGHRVIVVGGGVVGSLIAMILDQIPALEVVLVESHSGKRAILQRLPWNVAVVADSAGLGGFDRCFHASGSPLGLPDAIEAVGFEGLVIDVTWYGTKAVTLNLGGDFHHQRKRLVSSQVSMVARVARTTFDRRRRLDVVLKILHDPAFESMVTECIPFADLPGFMSRLYDGQVTALSVAVSYGE